ncbi:spore coat protein [Lentibacillus kapialis]|uniref:Spore coat protein n=1 Tax=Lentibacillus kapialis TaxID=340214 RepID=A0A917PWD0_9BACI|nr:CotY/CotZ family spore coat protein [Lentibacillus kapialis]GGJ95105.1 spore coat protein [Lentibacillus kapialis]
MGCGKERDFEKDYGGKGNCVADILKDIVEAQNDVIENCCETSCEQSINDLLGETENGNGLDTVPVILYCKDCKPFKGFGANRKYYRDNEDNSRNNIGEILSSFIFRVKRVDYDGCAVLELLLSDGDSCAYDHMKDPTDQDTKHLEATGICITVDLDCFCHVTCLPAIDVFNR